MERIDFIPSIPSYKCLKFLIWILSFHFRNIDRKQCSTKVLAHLHVLGVIRFDKQTTTICNNFMNKVVSCSCFEVDDLGRFPELKERLEFLCFLLQNLGQVFHGIRTILFADPFPHCFDQQILKILLIQEVALYNRTVFHYIIQEETIRA